MCLPCPAGKGCATAASTPQDCAAGYVSAAGQSNCTRCPNGKNYIPSTFQMYKCLVIFVIEKRKQTCNRVPLKGYSHQVII